tara:strand:- start:23845 stop:24864 length:1020 start_codon:yes stop_codon:yes gene_type:complete
MDLQNSNGLLITGGTGSFGRAFIKHLLHKYPKLRRIVVYSRDEFKQWQMMSEYPKNDFPQIRFFLGDIRDYQRLSIALEGIDTVVHAAALKHVPFAEYNPMEFVKTNVLGTENLIQACLENKVKAFIALSTDKAAAPINLYGATKLCSDKLVIAANNIRGSRDIKFFVVRYGNVFGSRGSVIPAFIEKARQGLLPITDPEMTRFTITLQEGVDFVFSCISSSLGGEIFVPKLSSYKILDVAEAIGPSCTKEFIGIRSGEKINEEMITTSDSPFTIQMEDRFIILPSDGDLLNKYEKSKIKFSKVNPNFSYNSLENDTFLNVEQLRNLIIKNIDKNFKPF